MEMGYNTLDLAMLAIAPTVIYAASRVPVKDAPAKKVGIKARPAKTNGSLFLK